MQVRHPREGDVLPIPLEFESFDPQWVWVYGNAVLIGAPAHDVFLMLRIVRYGEMPPLWAHRLFQHVRKEVRQRGFKRYMTWLSSEVEAERQLRALAERDRANFEPFKGDLVVGGI